MITMFSRRKALFVAAVAICSLADAKADVLPDSISYRVETQAAFSSGENTPFWLVNNRQGLSSIKKDNGYARASLFKHLNGDKRFSWGAGVDLAVAYGFTSTFVVQQLYGEIRYRSLGAVLGSKEQWSEINNRRLSSGGLFYSGNARPIPQLKVGIPEYSVIPWTNGWLSGKGYISYGMFTDDGWQKDFARADSKRTEDVLYHAKAGFLKIGDTRRFPLTFEAGLEMGAQFGGKSYKDGKVTKMPHGIKDIIKAFIPSSGSSDTPIGEQTNIYGNHVGSWDFRLRWAPNDADWSVSAYYEHYFEDHSMMFMQYKWKDMLLGVEFHLPANRFVSAVVYEYLNTKHQSGPVYWDHTEEIPEQVSGRDDYYNHYIYTGWQHWGMGIGNPLIISPIYNRDGMIEFKHNRVKGHHLGFEGSPLSWLRYRVLLSYTRSWGTYGTPLPEIEKNANALFEVEARLPKSPSWSGKVAVGADGGALLGRSFGVMLSICKSGWL